jgi:hypothetical protein
MNAFHQMDASVSKYIITMEQPAALTDRIEAADDDEMV